MELNTINKTGTWSETADRINSNFSKISIEVEEIKQNGGGGSGGGGGDVTNADHATSAYTLDKNTPVLDWFLSALNDDDAQGIINYLKGLKIAGNLINRIVKQGNKDVTYTDEDVMSALRVMTEIENSAEKLKEIFLRKDVADSTKYLLSLLGGALIKKYAKFGDFVTGVSGGYIDEKGDMEMGSGVFRKRLFVPEIAYNRTTYFKGRMVNSPGGGCSVLSYVDNGDGTYTITPDLTDADGLSQFVDDILTTYFVTKNSEGKLNGFEEMKFRVTAADYTAKKFTVIPRPGHSDWKPAEQMVLAQTGNFTDPERQTYILIDSVNGNNCITFFDNANTWDPEPAQMPAWFGKKKGMTVAGINADNYSAVLQNIIMTGLIFQVDEITGQTVRVPLDKGEWVAGKYAYYDRVSHNGALWLCVDDNGTTTEPSDDNPAWLKQVAEGQKGDPGLSVVGGGHWESAKTPYKANTMVTLANCVFISKVETSNPPIRILRVKGGNFLRKKDGGYYLAGKPADLEKLENLKLPDRKNNSRHILDAFLFCCYCGLRFSDFKQLTYKNLITIDGKEWLVLNSVKTGVKLNIPLYLLFNGKALGIMRKYDSIEQLAALGCNSDTNRTLQKLGRMAHIGKKFTYHTSRHTCATLLVHQGVPITTVQKLLGHTSVKTTEIYSEVFDETIIKDLTRANQIYSKRRNVKQNQIKSQKYSEKYLRQ